MNTLNEYCGATLLNNSGTNKMNKVKIEYYRTKEKIYCDSKQKIVYGISIFKKEYGKNEVKFEKRSVERITTNKNIVTRIIRLLKYYKVTPIALEDVLEDLLQQN